MKKNFVYLLSKIKNPSTNQIHLVDEIAQVIEMNEHYSTLLFINENEPIKVENFKFKVFDPHLTGDAFEKKICNRCNRLLPTQEFEINQNGKNNRSVRRPSCRACRKTINGVDISRQDRLLWEKRKPNYEIWECPICHKRTIPGLTSKVVLDHDHQTGKPRSYICDSCNTGLGRFMDDVDILNNAIVYLESFKKIKQ